MSEFEDIQDEKLELIIDGKPTVCDLLFTYDGGDVDKPIIGYTDNTTGPNGELNIYVSKYDPLFGPEKFEDITDPKEMELVKDIVKQIQEKYG